MSQNADKPQSYQWIGSSPIRPDGIDKVTGRANFGADHNLPGMLHGKILRSPIAHGIIKSIDLSAALALPGVFAAICRDDFPDHTTVSGVSAGEAPADLADIACNIMARDKVLYHGHAVAAVAASSAEIATAALELIVVEYEELTPVLNLDAATASDAPILHSNQFTKGLPEKPSSPSNTASVLNFKRGDIEKGFAEADVIIEQQYTTPTAHQGYIEPHAVTASCNEDGRASVWCCTQGPFVVRSLTASVLDWDVGRIKVTPSEIGGGFGGKTVVYLEPLAVKLAEKSSRPVKMVMSREEVFRATGPTSASRSHVKLGADKNGKITAVEIKIECEAGAFKGAPVGPACMTALACYDLENFAISGYDIVVNKPKAAAYRAPGAPQSAFAIESAVDEAVKKLQLDPINFRLNNAAKKGTVAPYGAKFPVIGLVETLEAAKAHPHYSAALGPNQGRGIACGFWFNVGMQSSAAININENGTATVITANPDIGGSRASMALMAAEALGIPYDKINAIVADTESSGYSDVTGGSRTTFATGKAVIQTAEKIIDELRTRAAALWKIETEQVEWKDGKAHPTADANIDKPPFSLEDLSRSAAKTGGPISARASLTAQGAGAGFGTHICDVEVDPETGKTQIIRYTAIQDAGKAIHRAYVEGQLQGGATQGIGWALNEEYVFDDRGVMQNPSFLDYRMPVALDLPMIDTVIVEVPNPSHPYGVRGVGETPIVPPLGAVANAIDSATNTRIRDLPINPPKLLKALTSA